MKTPEQSSYKTYYQEFIDLAAHDLDAPLRKLHTLVERMLEKIKSAQPVDDQAARVLTCVNDMRGMLDALTQLSRQSIMEGEMEKVHLQEELMLALQQFKENAELQEEITSLPVIDGYASAIRALFYELIGNAVKFKQARRPLHLRVDATEATQQEISDHDLDDKKKYWRIRFTDNGIGFAVEDAQRIFDAFVRLHGKSEYAGYGVGLALCRRIAANHAGAIYANTPESGGAQFVLLLPQSPA